PGEDHVRGGDHAGLVEHPRVIDKRRAGVEVVADEDAVRPETAFSEIRVLGGQRRGGVLMLGQAYPAGRAQCGGAGLTGGREQAGGFTIGPLDRELALRLLLLGRALRGRDAHGGLATFLPRPAPLRGRGEQDGGVQALLLAHNPSPRSCLTAATPGCSNHDPDRAAVPRPAASWFRAGPPRTAAGLPGGVCSKVGAGRSTRSSAAKVC